LALKTRLSVLWLINAVGGLASTLLELYEPGVIDQIRSGVKRGEPIGPAYLLLLSIVFLVPLVMAFLSQTLKDKANRWTNIITGAVYVVLVIVVLLQYLEYQSVLAINSVFGIVFSALIVWYAYKWSKN
jgi:hypothetical protein